MRIHHDRRLQQLRVDLSCVPLHVKNGGCFFLIDHDSSDRERGLRDHWFLPRLSESRSQTW